MHLRPEPALRPGDAVAETGSTTVDASIEQPSGIDTPPAGDRINCWEGPLPSDVVTIPVTRCAASVDRSHELQG